MTTSIDPDEMRAAVPRIESLIALLEDAARRLAAVTTPPGVPPGVAARVDGAVEVAARGLRDRSRLLRPLPGELRQRMAAAAQADAPWQTVASWTIPLAGLYGRSFSIQTLSRSMAWGMAAREVGAGLAAGERYAGAGPRGSWTAFRLSGAAAKGAGVTRGVPPTLATAARVGGRGLKWASWGLTAYSNIKNPRLSTGQKIGRTGASIATGAGVSVLAGAASGAAFGSAAGPVGTLVGFGAGTAWTVLDGKLHVSNAIGDAAADAADTIGDAAGDAAGAIGDGAKSVAGKVLGGLHL